MENREQTRDTGTGVPGVFSAKIGLLARRGIEILRSELCRQYRGLTAALLHLVPVADACESSMSTDGTCLFYSPEYVVGVFSADQKRYKCLQYEYLHIVIHCLFGHVRKKAEAAEAYAGYEQWSEMYDLCADFAVNVILEEMTGKNRIKGWNYHFGGTGAVQVYEKLQYGLKHRTFLSFVRYCLENQMARKGLESFAASMTSDSHIWWNVRNPVTLREENSPGQRAYGETQVSGLRRAADDWERILGQTMVDLQNMGGYFSLGIRPGILPGRWAMEVEAQSENASNYRELLRRYCEYAELPQREEAEYDWAWYEMGMQLYGNIPILEPAETVEDVTIRELVIALDTSGSCLELAPRFLRETMNLLRDMQGESGYLKVRLLECDARIQRETIITENTEIPDLKHAALSGWGGTSFVPVFAYIREKQEQGEMGKVRGLLYFTDGCGDFPAEAPDYETVFIMPGDEADIYDDCGREMIPDWIRVMHLTESDIEQLEEG